MWSYQEEAYYLRQDNRNNNNSNNINNNKNVTHKKQGNERSIQLKISRGLHEGTGAYTSAGNRWERGGRSLQKQQILKPISKCAIINEPYNMHIQGKIYRQACE
ncbi:hypothetical protein OTU49_000011 [Cherax quadricarinatus]|uniref:Uncharacterized protein n=1 Tax=Cherax quadricarinatus TaxID=27406 RepID=A0AAW0Y307_CHEQU